MKSPPISRLSGCIAAALVLCLVAGVCAGPGWTPPPYRPPPTPYWTPYRPQPTPYRTPYRAPTPYRTPYRAPTPYRPPYRAPTPYRTPSTPYRPSPTPYRNPTISGKQATPTRTPFQANKSTSAARPNNRVSTVKWASGNAPKVRQNIRNAASNAPTTRRQQLQKQLAAFKQRLANKLKLARSKPLASKPRSSPTPASNSKVGQIAERLKAPPAEIPTPSVPAKKSTTSNSVVEGQA